MPLKEITDLLGVRHDRGMAKVTEMLQDVDFGAVSKIDIAYNSAGQTTETYLLNKRQSIAVASRLNTPLLMRILDRWQELEDAQKQLLPQTHIEAVRAYLVTLETVEAQQKELGMQQQVITKQDETIEEKKIITDDSDIYFSTQRLSSIFYPIKFDGRVLSRKSEEMQIDWQEQHTPFKSQQPIRVYHYAVVEAAYGVDFGY